MFGLASDFRVRGVRMKSLQHWCPLCKQAGQNQYLLYSGLTCVDARLSPFNSFYIHNWCCPGWEGWGRCSRKGEGVASLGYLCPYFDSSVDRWPLHPHWCSLVEAFLLWCEEKNMSCVTLLFTSIFFLTNINFPLQDDVMVKEEFTARSRKLRAEYVLD